MKFRSSAANRTGTRHTRTVAARALGALLAMTAVVTVVSEGASSQQSPAYADAASATVQVGQNGHALNGINGVRQANQLILYTRTATQLATPTNIYGAEIVVVNGKVIAINDRLRTGGSATAIPGEGYVLSGHGEAHDWLMDHTTLGQSVTLPSGTGALGATPIVTPPTTPTTNPAPALPAGTVGLDGSTMSLNGTDTVRQANYLVVYTCTANQTVTPTNIYGAEIVVVGGLVASVNDRLITGGAATAIPTNGYVLSGHGTARDWLVAHAQVGRPVALPTGTVTTAPVTTAPVTTAPVTTAPPSTTTHKWLSGESDTSTVRDGSFAAWRGRAVDIGGTWAANDTPANQIASAGWSISPGNAYAATPRMDYAVGGPLQGETWAQAAAGQFDTRWAQQLRVMKTAWGTRAASNMYIRFAHEMNGNWYSWTVTPGDIANYITAWHRYYNLIQGNFPGAKLVWCANAGSSYNYDIRSLYPGDTYVDVVSVDAYNRDPWVNTTAAFTTKTNSLSPQGGPLGLESWRKFALSHGKPLAISEWSNASVNAGGGGGDAPVFMQEYNKWLTANGGTGAGNILYEVLFNVGGYSDHYEMFQQGQPSGYEPQAAAMYKALW